MFNFLKKRKENINLDESIIKASQKPKGYQFLDYKNYALKPISWIENHLKVVEDIVYGEKLGSKKKNTIVIGNRTHHKDEVTSKYFDQMIEVYRDYFFLLKRFLSIKKNLEKIENIKDKDYLIEGKKEQLLREQKEIEKDLNIYFDKITRYKLKIRKHVFS